MDLFSRNSDLGMIFMDIKLPDINGLEVTKIIRNRNSDIVIVAQTAYAFEEDIQNALAAGCNDIITKPITQWTIEEVIRKYLN